MKRVFGLILGLMFFVGGMTAASAATIRYSTTDDHPAEIAAAAAKLATSIGGSSAAGFAANDDAAWSSALAVANIILVGQDAGTGSLSASTRTNIKSWVSSGGVLLVLWDSANLALLDGVMDSKMTWVSGGSDSGTPLIPKTASAAGTTFATAPAALGTLNNHGGISTSSLPFGANSMYALGTTTHVMVDRVGAGTAAFLSWDWCCGDTPTTRGEWDSALLAAATFAGGFAKIEIPTLSEWGLIVMSSLLGLTALVVVRRRT
jgi:hypothetical protein